MTPQEAKKLTPGQKIRIAYKNIRDEGTFGHAGDKEISGVLWVTVKYDGLKRAVVPSWSIEKI